MPIDYEVTKVNKPDVFPQSYIITLYHSGTEDDLYLRSCTMLHRCPADHWTSGDLAAYIESKMEYFKCDSSYQKLNWFSLVGSLFNPNTGKNTEIYKSSHFRPTKKTLIKPSRKPTNVYKDFTVTQGVDPIPLQSVAHWFAQHDEPTIG
jgi:hypothetical protein